MDAENCTGNRQNNCVIIRLSGFYSPIKHWYQVAWRWMQQLCLMDNGSRRWHRRPPKDLLWLMLWTKIMGLAYICWQWRSQTQWTVLRWTD